MLERNLDTKEAPTKWWAAQDARMRNLANKSHYSEQTQIRAERMVMALGVAIMHEVFTKRLASGASASK
jgi:hypothetical protein